MSDREIRIDIMRGYAMITIAINHTEVMLKDMGFGEWNFPTLGNYNYSSAAELFVFLSGYMTGLIYFRRNNPFQSIIERTRQIYLVSIYIFLLSGGLVALFPQQLASVTGFTYFFSNPIEGGLGFLLLVRQPVYIDVLHLYVLLMLFVALLSWQFARRPAIVLGFSFGLYAAVQISHLLGFRINMPGGTGDGSGQWNFNPFAWQFLFLFAVWAAQRRLLSLGFAMLKEHRSLCVLSICLMILIVIVHYFDQHFGLHVPFVWKSDLQPVRLFNFFLMLASVMSVLVLCDGFLRSPPFAFLQVIGRNTLHCYAASIPLSYVIGFSVTWFGLSVVYLSTATVAFVGAMYLVAVTRERLFVGKPLRSAARVGFGEISSEPSTKVTTNVN